ncbi:polyprenyl synthetase family protein [Streptomyces sp. NPDC050560]|uniref:polyprenyl synthetase family protein n=1 Tax=Streptomyces sp. NPDC050560 TaxID=3365630 RepID=UPI00378B14F5
MTTGAGTPAVAAASARDTLRRQRRRLMDLAEERLRAFLAAEHTRWRGVGPGAVVPLEAISELVTAGGKRLRPAFCVSGYLAAGGDPEDPRAVPAAIALELLHASALIHDDMMDAASHRRGLPTVHAKQTGRHRDHGWHGEPRRFGESMAVLAGDLALVYSDRFMAEVPFEIRELWGELRTELITGQCLDISAAAHLSTDPRLARHIALTKSGHYTVHRPLVIGAALAGRPGLAPFFEAYGTKVGEAFQLRDDLIDAFGTTTASGKPAGLDLSRRKMTLLLSLAVERDDRVRALVRAGRIEPERLRPLLAEAGVADEVERTIERLVTDGRNALATAPLPQQWRDELVDMAYAVAYRTT